MTQVAAEPFSEVGVSLCPPVDDLSFSNKAPGVPLHLWHKVALLVALSWWPLAPCPLMLCEKLRLSESTAGRVTLLLATRCAIEEHLVPLQYAGSLNAGKHAGSGTPFCFTQGFNEDGERRNLLEPGAASAQQNLKLSVATGNILIQQNAVLPSA